MLSVTVSAPDRRLLCTPWKSSQKTIASSSLQQPYGITQKRKEVDKTRSIVRLSVRTHTSPRQGWACSWDLDWWSCSLDWEKGGQYNCQHFINELSEMFISFSQLLCRNISLHAVMPLMPVSSTICSKTQMKRNYFLFTGLWRERMYWAGLSTVFLHSSVKAAKARAQRGK